MSITFDQYQRYKNIQITVELVKKYYNIDKLNILEVGSNEQLNLEKFLPNENITYSDLEIPESMKEKTNFIKADATDLSNIKDNEYDIVISSDVFEHIPHDKRKEFLSETSRVGKIITLHCFPFFSENVKSAEIRTNEYYKCIFGKDHIWLIEHIENGLPDIKEVESTIKSMNKNYVIFEHGDIMLWEEMTKSTFYSYNSEELIAFQAQIDDFYNANVFKSDTGENNYRKFIVISDDENLSNYILNKRKSIFNSKLSERNFNFIYRNIQDMRSIWQVYKYKQNLDVKNEQMELYLDVGEGFNEESKIKREYAFDKGIAVINFFTEIPPGVRCLRFDPIEGKSVVLYGLTIISNNGNEEYEVINGKEINDYIVINSIDPQIIIKNSENINWIKIQCTCSIFEYEAAVELLDLFIKQSELNNIANDEINNKNNEINNKNNEINQLNIQIDKLNENVENLNRKIEDNSNLLKGKEKIVENLQGNLSYYKLHYETAIQQREDLNNRLLDVQNKFNIISNSTCWKITKPLRICLDGTKNLLKMNKYTHTLCKGIKYCKNNGIKSTIKKFKNLNKYEEYISKNILTEEEIDKQINTEFSKDIKFSIVVPLYNTPEKFLSEMMDSCIGQTYGNWELCLADGSDKDHAYVGEIVKKYTAKDKRIKYTVLEDNKGISENTNECIKMATGDYIALFDHDDVLHPSVLYEYMKVICEKDADFIYCDEDKFEDDISKAFNPYFKPDFAIDNLRVNNYICHFSVFKKELLNEVGLFRKEFDGSQDHDMILRLTEKAKNIVHVPKILYHWRVSSSSVASDPYAKPYTIKAGINAIKQHLERCNLKADVESSDVHPNIYRIKYDIIGKPLISILIPNKDHIEDLSRCINSILKKSTYRNFEIIVIENNSTEQETFDYYKSLEEYDNIKVVTYKTDGRFNYSAINNFGVKYAKGEHLLFLNNDIEVISEKWLEEMLMYCQRNDVGAVGAKLYYPNDTIQHAGVILGLGGVAGHSHKYFPRTAQGYFAKCVMVQNYSAVTAACLMMRTEIFKQINGFDELFEVAFNDVDLCMRIRKAGYIIVWTPYAELYHYESISRGYEDTPEKQARFSGEIRRFQDRWKDELEAGDPYYNINLTMEREDFSLK